MLLKLVKSGVARPKIEGRMKSAALVLVTGVTGGGPPIALSNLHGFHMRDGSSRCFPSRLPGFTQAYLGPAPATP